MNVETSYKNVVLAEQNLTELPSSLLECNGVEILNLGKNQFEKLSEEFGNLRNLQELKLGTNRIKKLPDELSKLTYLRKLHLGDNQVESIEEVSGIKSLEELWLGNNNISRIPESINLLPKLSILHLGNNPIERLPESLVELEHLTVFLHHCPSAVIPPGFKGKVYEKLEIKSDRLKQLEEEEESGK